jgi:CRP-like cAMP-binding protein
VQTLDQLIAQAPVFSGLSPEHLELIAGCARNRHVDAGLRVMREGEPADRFFLIRRGAVALEINAPGHDPLVIETRHAGDMVGWSWLFAPYRWQLDGRTVAACELIAFDGRCLREKCDTDHELGYRLMSSFAADLVETLQATRLQLVDVYGHASTPA